MLPLEIGTVAHDEGRVLAVQRPDDVSVILVHVVDGVAMSGRDQIVAGGILVDRIDVLSDFVSHKA